MGRGRVISLGESCNWEYHGKIKKLQITIISYIFYFWHMVQRMLQAMVLSVYSVRYIYDHCQEGLLASEFKNNFDNWDKINDVTKVTHT